MKTILIATDFSSASRVASLYGVQFAKALNAKIILFNAYKIPHSVPALTVSISRYDIMMQTDKKLIDEADFLDPKRTLIEIMCDEGDAENAIINIANEKKIDFIIAGMKGGGKNLKKIFGSTAASLTKDTNIPLILIPENAGYKSPEIIVFASDLGLNTDLHAIEELTNITQFFKSKLYVVTVLKNKNKDWFEVLHTPQTLRKAVEGSGATFEYPIDIDITHALNSFIEKHDADMLVMMPHRHEWLERIFRKSETKDMIFHTHVPLLILPERMLEENHSLYRKKVIQN
jgi:nucleotide-binding universal stress UspA family protein